MTIEELIVSVDSKMVNNYINKDKLDWVNEIELSIYSEIIKELYQDDINIIEDQGEYALDGYTFEDIENVRVNGFEYKKGSLKYHNAMSYYKKNNKLVLDPTPNAAGTMEIIYRHIPAKKIIGDISTDELLLPEQFQKAYNYYLYAQILMLNKEYGEANNYISLYNATIRAFKFWYMKKQPTVAAKVNDKWKKGL